MKKILVFLIIIFSFSNCQQILDSAASVGKENIKPEELKHIRVNNDYSMAIPTYMKEMNSLHDEASFEYANIFKETYTVVLDESKQEFIDAFKEMEMYNDSISALKNYTEVQLESFKENIDDLKINKTNINVKNISSSVYEFHGKVEGTKIGYLVGFIEGKEKMYLIMSWTLENRFKKYEDTFKIIQESFKFI